MDLESAAAELYAGSPEDFVERRKTLVAAARATKDRTLATAIGKLRRPTRSAWLVNLYARENADEVAALLELGAALQAAQEQLSATDLRRLSGERQKTLAAATRSVVELGEAQGYTATDAVRQEVGQTLQAALADPDVATQVRAGTVTEAHAYGGFGTFGLAAQDSRSPAVSAAVVAETCADTDDSDERAEAEEELRSAERELSTATEEAEQTTAQADELAARVETLRAELAEAEQAETEARDRARGARRRAAELEQAVRAARDAYEAR